MLIYGNTRLFQYSANNLFVKSWSWLPYVVFVKVATWKEPQSTHIAIGLKESKTGV
jgi:hypothetical protein